jgi:hypothetical protein
MPTFVPLKSMTPFTEAHVAPVPPKLNVPTDGKMPESNVAADTRATDV